MAIVVGQQAYYFGQCLYRRNIPQCRFHVFDEQCVEVILDCGLASGLLSIDMNYSVPANDEVRVWINDLLSPDPGFSSDPGWPHLAFVLSCNRSNVK